MATTITLKAVGLNTDPNQLELQEGSLIEANNVIIERDNVIQPSRGYKIFGETLGGSTDRCKQLFEYKDRIIRHYGSTLDFQNGTLNNGTAHFSIFSGSYTEPKTGTRIKNIDSSGNMYFTSSDGIKKISAKVGTDLTTASGYITNAGGIKAVDFVTRLKTVLGDQSSFLPQDSAVAYRILWSYKDANSILIPGTPSQREEVFNPMSELLVRDTNNVLLALDYVSNATTPSLISTGDYVNTLSLPITATAAEIRNALIALTGKIDTNITFGTGTGVGVPLHIDTAASVFVSGGVYTIHFSSGNPTTYMSVGDQIYLSGFDTVISGTMNGVGTVASVTSNSVSILTSVPNSIAEVETIKVVADVASSLNNKYFFINEVGGNGYYVWFNVGGAGVNPGPFGSRTAVPVAFPANSNASAVASAVSVAMNAIAGTPFTLTVNNDTVTCTHTVAGLVTGASDAGSTTFTFNVTVRGSNSVSVQSAANITSGRFRNLTQPGETDIPTPNSQLVALQDYLSSIITNLQLEPSSIIAAPSQTAFISSLDVTKTSTVILNITVPSGITNSHFYQIYRSGIAQATGTTSISNIAPNDELQLVYEAFPTPAELAAKKIVVTDITPDEFRADNLYTNAATGEGILQANDTPPFALDINRFKNVVFYANTRTRHKQIMSLLGVQNMITSYNSAGAPSLSIISENGTVNKYLFVTGQYQITQIVCQAGSTLAATGAGSYFLINSGENDTQYYVWYQLGSNTDPAIAGKTGIMVVAKTTDNANTIASKTTNVLLSYSYDFTATVSTNTISAITIKPGYTTNSTAGTSGFTVTTPQSGRGEAAGLKQVLLSPSVSVGTAVDETARSLVRVINANSSDVVNAYYTSSSSDVPGQFYLEARNLNDTIFYVIGDSASTGQSFNPNISPTFTISSITTGLNPVITTTTPHNISNNEKIVISLTNSTPSIDGEYVAKFLTTTTFSVQLLSSITIAGTSGVGYDYNNAVISQNETKPNRIYYSKKDQPEAVPLTNYIPVGDSNKAILRIFPLRESLFVFKEDGLYRISGQVAPFSVSLFDSSVILTGPDTLDVTNNILFGLTTQGITQVSEGGASALLANPVESAIKRVVAFPNYKSIAFGMGYESDNSYTVFLPTSSADAVATLGWRYSTKTRSWTNIQRTASCGFINPTDDTQYLGAGDVNFIEQERKMYSRVDYCGRETTLALTTPNYFGNILQFSNVSGISAGDVFVQSQNLTVYEFNLLLKKLDLDPGIPTHNFYSTIAAVPGANLRTSILALAAKLDSELGGTTYSSPIASLSGSITGISNGATPTITTSSPHGLKTGRYVLFSGSNSTPAIDGNYVVTVTSPTTFTIPFNVDVAGTSAAFSTVDNDFLDIKGCYNILVGVLNSDSVVAFSNYAQNNTQTDQEAIVLSVDPTRSQVTVNLTLEFVSGPITNYKAIPRTVTYAPNLFGDPVNYKHVREATMMFIDKSFTSAQLSFHTDLLPEFIPVPFNGDGNGIFGNQLFGSGFFGGASNSAPFRTYIPRNCQRCRYVVCKFTHLIARETFGIFGMTMTGENTQSSRAYRG